MNMILKIIELVIAFLSLDVAKNIWESGNKNIVQKIFWAVKSVIPRFGILLCLIFGAIYGFVRLHLFWREIGKKILWRYDFLTANFSFIQLINIIDATFITFCVLLFAVILYAVFQFRTKGEHLKNLTHEAEVTELKTGVERARAENRALIDLSPNPICVLDRDLVIMDVNLGYQKFVQRFGLPQYPVGAAFFHIYWFLVPFRDKIIRTFSCTETISITEVVPIGREQYEMEILKIPVKVGGENIAVILYTILKENE